MSESKSIQRTCRIVNKHGLHTRSAAAIVDCANQYISTITITAKGITSEASDMIRLLLLEANYGTEVIITAEGMDAIEALEAMSDLFQSGFYENDK